MVGEAEVVEQAMVRARQSAQIQERVHGQLPTPTGEKMGTRGQREGSRRDLESKEREGNGRSQYIRPQ